MTPSNPDNNQPLIYRICDAAGVFHLVAPVNHTHSQSDIDGLAAALAAKANAIHPGSPSGGIVIAATSGEIVRSNITILDLQNDIAAKQNILTFDSTPTEGSTNPVTSGGVAAALEGKQDALTFDTTPTANSTNPVTSGGVKTALDSKQNTLTFDSTPTANSTNPVTSGGVKAAIDAASADPMLIIRGLSEGDSVYLDGELPQPNTMARFIIRNEYENDYAMPLWDIFYSNTLPVHKSGSENDELPNGEYLLATVFRINSSEHTHPNCYFVLFEGIFSE